MINLYKLPPSYKNVTLKIAEIKKTYPLIQVFTVCKSVLGRKIYALGIGNLKKANLFVGSVHASEWLTSSLLLNFFEEFCMNIFSKQKNIYKNMDMLSEKGLVIIPMLNPDGVEIAINGTISAKHRQNFINNIINKNSLVWQANANGVDLNHNFDAGFALCKNTEKLLGYTSPSPRFYGGKYPHNQPESLGLVNLCTSLNIQKAFAFHSQGEEIFFEYGNHTTTQSFYIASLLSSYSGYTICKQSGSASHGGFKDWFIDKLHRPAFTIEIGKGVNPLPISDLHDIYTKLTDMLFISALI